MFSIRLVIMSLAVLAASACGGCGATTSASLRAHSTAAAMFEDVAGTLKAAELDKRQAELDKVAADAKAEGLDRTAALERTRLAEVAYDEAAKTREGAINTFIVAKQAYVRLVLGLAMKEKPTWSEAKIYLRHAVDAYKNLRAALNNPPSMPDIPDAVAGLLSSAEPVPDGIATAAPDRPAFLAPAGGVSWV